VLPSQALPHQNQHQRNKKNGYRQGVMGNGEKQETILALSTHCLERLSPMA